MKYYTDIREDTLSLRGTLIGGTGESWWLEAPHLNTTCVNGFTPIRRPTPTVVDQANSCRLHTSKDFLLSPVLIMNGDLQL